MFTIAAASQSTGKKGQASRKSRSESRSSEDVGGGAVLNPVRTFQIGMLAGAVAGFTVDAVLFPLDTLKTRLQMAGNAAARKELFKGIYSGFAPAVAASAPAAAAFFGTYDYIKRVLAAASPDGSTRWAPAQHLVAAAAGDIASSTVRVPFEVVKQRMQSGMHRSSAEAVRAVWTKEGVRGFFAGYGSLIVRELPFDAIQFPLYELLKVQWSKRTRTGTLETWQQSACGSMAGGFAAAVTTPFDVVKTRLMTQGAATSGSTAVVPYKGVVDGLTRIAREEGFGALFSGIAPRVVWISVGGAVFFGSYEAARKALLPHFSALSNEDREAERPLEKR